MMPQNKDTNLKMLHNICMSRKEERDKSTQSHQGLHPDQNLRSDGSSPPWRAKKNQK